jgi:hypothetical protein
MKVLQIIKNAILITIGNPINSIMILICNGVIVYISVVKFTFLIPFFMGSIMATFTFWQFYRGFQKLQTKQQALEEKERERNEELEKEKTGNDEHENAEPVVAENMNKLDTEEKTKE